MGLQILVGRMALAEVPGAEEQQLNNVYSKDDPQTWEEIQANGDAAIIGVGH